MIKWAKIQNTHAAQDFGEPRRLNFYFASSKSGKKDEMEEIILLFEDHALSLFVKKYIEECHHRHPDLEGTLGKVAGQLFDDVEGDLLAEQLDDRLGDAADGAPMGAERQRLEVPRHARGADEPRQDLPAQRRGQLIGGYQPLRHQLRAKLATFGLGLGLDRCEELSIQPALGHQQLTQEVGNQVGAGPHQLTSRDHHRAHGLAAVHLHRSVSARAEEGDGAAEEVSVEEHEGETSVGS